MNKNIIKGLAFGITSLMFCACNDSMSDLLEPKVYFEHKEYNLTVEDSDVMSFDLTARISSAVATETGVSYIFADSTAVKEYNAKYGTNYGYLDESHVNISSQTATIQPGQIFADKVQLEFTGLDTMEEGKSFMLPVVVTSNSVPASQGSNMAYFLVSKPIKIKTAANFNGNGYVDVTFPAGTYFKSFTYEALIYPERFTQNMTIIGTEGLMILRIGDTGGGVPGDILQIAGQQHYEVGQPLQTRKWYHVACTYDQSSGKTAIYVNGEPWAQASWAIPGFDPNGDVGFKIGKLNGFPWGERPFYGAMSEVRVWSVSRTQNQIKQNMLTIDPQSEGLELYFKFNGEVKELVGKATIGAGGITTKQLNTPIEIK